MRNEFVIFCFTYAGGTAKFFEVIEDALKPEVKLVKLEYSGHGSRAKEKLCEDFIEVSDDLYPVIRDYIKEYNISGYALMGYSMGSIVAFVMLQKIKTMDEIPLPKHVFLAAHEPMTRIIMSDIPEEEIDEYVKKRTIEFDAVGQDLIDNRVFWRMYLPLYKADYFMIARYNFEDMAFSTSIPATVFYSEEDTAYSDMVLWKKYFTEDVEYDCYEGPHFFINDHFEDMAKTIKRRLELI